MTHPPETSPGRVLASGRLQPGKGGRSGGSAARPGDPRCLLYPVAMAESGESRGEPMSEKTDPSNEDRPHEDDRTGETSVHGA